MKHVVIGTAGHVDHGKTALIRALTGINTDRLKEEQDRGLTIELGFANMTLPSGQPVSFVDVPGHEHFIKNMLAGATGMDAVVMVIAADEGIMPQTREHMHILNILGISGGVVALTKCDLVDEEWLQMVTSEVKEFLKGTSFKCAPVIPCSSVTGEGLGELQVQLGKLISGIKERSAAGQVRLPVDRAFVKDGFGSVVTGTLWSGSIRVGDKLHLWPLDRDVRVRGLQNHGKSTEETLAGTRTAVNLSGISLEDIPRGSWLASEGLLSESSVVDVRITLIKEAKTMANNCRVRIHHGTAEIIGRVRLLDRDELLPGESCFAQLMTETPVYAFPGDVAVLRRFAELDVVGGAKIIAVNSARLKRNKSSVLETLAQKERGTYDEQGLKAAVLWERAEAEITCYCRTYPLRSGIPEAQLRQKTDDKLTSREFRTYLESWKKEGRIDFASSGICIAGYRPHLTEKQRNFLKADTEMRIKAFPETLPWDGDSELFAYARSEKLLIQADAYIFDSVSVSEAKALLLKNMSGRVFAVGDVKALWNTNRKRTVALLEYFDSVGITRRTEDGRIVL